MTSPRPRSSPPAPSGEIGPRQPQPTPAALDRPYCPICAAQGVEKKQKWFCPRCGQLIQTCCD